jgi:hypothetical protein
MINWRGFAVGVVVGGLALGSSAQAAEVLINRTITKEDVTKAQRAWCEALVDISKAYETGGQSAAKALAEKVIDSAYAYDDGGVLFKPTLTVNPQTVRTSRAGALAYFVGGDPEYPNDKGFALKGWTSCVAEDNAIIILGESATSLGKVRITNKDGSIVTVDKTWQYVKDRDGNLRIVVHHSSLEYSGQ